MFFFPGVALSAAQISSLRLQSSPYPTVGLVAYWPADDGEGTILRGLSRNRNVGTLVGAVAFAASRSTIVNTAEDVAVIIPLNGSHVNGVAIGLTVAISLLPGAGSLFQCTSAYAQGAAILTVPTTVTGPGGRVFFVPAASAFGTPYTTFQYTVNDGTSTSVAGVVTVNVAFVLKPPTVSVTTPFRIGLTDFRYVGCAAVICTVLPRSSGVCTS